MTILIDSNKTIENVEKIKTHKKDFLKRMEIEHSLKEGSLTKYSQSFTQKYGNIIWEYHPIFWRCVSKDLLSNENYVNLYESFLKFYEENITLYDDVMFFLQKCQRNHRIALIANGNERRLNILINKFSLNDFFDEIVISGETPYRKPDHFMFEFALKRLNSKIEDAIMIGDRYDTDIIGAKKAGIKTVLIKRSNNEQVNFEITPEYMPDITIFDFKEAWHLISCYESQLQLREQLHNKPKESLSTITSALILAGGKGRRLGSLGAEKQKCMLSINKFPLLLFQINALKNAGCKSFVIVVNHLSEQVKGFFGNGDKFGVKIHYLEGPFISTYDAMYHALPYLEDVFYYCHGNIVFEERLIEKLWDVFKLFKKNTLAIVKNSKEITHAKLRVTDSRVEQICLQTKDINETDYNYTFMGLAIYDKKSILLCHDGNFEGMVEKHIKVLLENKGEAYCYKYNKNWWHIESLSDYERIKEKYFWEVGFVE